jgi:hypothetical protein
MMGTDVEGRINSEGENLLHLCIRIEWIIGSFCFRSTGAKISLDTDGTKNVSQLQTL